MNKETKRIARNRDKIDSVLSLMNEGYLSPREAKEMITMYSDDNKRLIQLKKDGKGIVK